MRIGAVELRRIGLPLVVPFRTSFGTETDRDILLIRVSGDDGATGWGECVHQSTRVARPGCGGSVACERGPRSPIVGWRRACRALVVKSDGHRAPRRAGRARGADVSDQRHGSRRRHPVTRAFLRLVRPRAAARAREIDERRDANS